MSGEGARCELAEAAAFADVWEGLGAPSRRVAGATCLALADEPQHLLFNRVVGLGVSEPVGDGDLDEIDGFYRDAGVRHYAIALARDAGAGLEGRLRERGFTPGYPWMRFRRGIEPPPEVASEVRVVETGDGAAFGRVVATGSGLPLEVGAGFGAVAGRPGWHLFLALAGGEPAGAGALFARDGIGWLGAAATLPEQRGRGAQTALLAARIARAAKLGLETLTVETGKNLAGRPNQSYRNILRAGFAEWYLRPNLVSPPR
ncbi:MAG TPA: GNAT family N-acetyltransferase [Gaiellaceae bacterium]|nr:GNAT family N-acetyltransferase [Gaiellaceae bacterium]